MKILLCSLFALFRVISLLSQDWAPFPPGDTLIYDHPSTPDPDFSVWVDQVKETAEGEDWVLNPYFRPCDTCNPVLYGGYRPLLINQPFPFGRRVQWNHKGRYSFDWGEGPSVVIFPEAPTGELWLMDSTLSIWASVTSRYKDTIWGGEDDFMVISLSTGDSIILSRKHGLLSFPEGVSHGEPVELAGIYNRSQGIDLLGFWDIYGYQQGDVLYYSYGESSELGTYYFGSKVTVLGTLRKYDTLLVEVVMKGTATFSNSWYNIPERKSGFSNLFDTWKFINPGNRATNALPGTLQPLFWPVGRFLFRQISWRSTPLLYNSTFVAPVILTDSILEFSDYYLADRFDDYRGMWSQMPDSLPPDLIPRTSDFENFSMKFERGIGLTRYSYSGFESGAGLTLVGYIRGQDTVGTIFTEEDLHVSVEEGLAKEGILIFPNPANGPVTIQVARQELLPLRLSVWNFAGQIVHSCTVTQQELTLETGHLPPGIYPVQVQVSDGRLFQAKLVVP